MTLSRKGLERSVPSELRATQKYCPLSVYLRRDRWSCGLKLSGMLPLSISAEHIMSRGEIKVYKMCINFTFKQSMSVTCALTMRGGWSVGGGVAENLRGTFEPSEALYRRRRITGAG